MPDQTRSHDETRASRRHQLSRIAPVLPLVAFLVVVGLAAVSRLTDDADLPAGADGTWTLRSATTAPPDPFATLDLMLEVEGTVVRADTMCTTVTIDFESDEAYVPAVGCDAEGYDALRLQGDHVAVLRSGGRFEGSHLVFEGRGLKFVYERQ